MGDNAARDTHRLQFLEQEFIRIRNLNCGEVRGIATATTLPDALFWIRNRQKTTITTRPAAEQV